MVWSQLETLHKNYCCLKWIHWGKKHIMQWHVQFKRLDHVGDPANVSFFWAPKPPDIFVLNADRIWYSRGFMRHTSRQLTWIPEMVWKRWTRFTYGHLWYHMLDFWGVSSQTWFITRCFFLRHAAVPGHERLVSDVFYLIFSGRAVYVSFAGSSHFDWKWQCFLALFSKCCWFCILSIGRKAFGMLLHPLTALLWVWGASQLQLQSTIFTRVSTEVSS